MYYYDVTPLKITHSTQEALTYCSEKKYGIGRIVRIPLGKSTVIGVITKLSSKPSFDVRPINDAVESITLPTRLIALANWMSEFYATHPSIVWQTILPSGVAKKRRPSDNELLYPSRDRTTIVLNSDQKAAIRTIMQQTSGTALLHGITGSGKTQVYIELIKQQLNNGASCIVLIPEIALTSQIISELMPHFPNTILTHSTMPEAQRHKAWQKALYSKDPCVVVGPRSALFSPLPNLGLIIIDECHEPAFKQEQNPRYSALRTAAKLAAITDAKLVLGSATPSVSDYYLAQHSGAQIVSLKKPAKKHTIAPVVTVIDMTKQLHFTRHRFLSNELIAAIQNTLDEGNQCLLFHNRRGSSPTTLCELCGWNALCIRCFVPLTLHTDSFELRCHICSAVERVPLSCPMCHNTGIIHKGIGTKLIESEVKKLFSTANIMRFDGDTEMSLSLDKQYQSLYDGKINIIIGTQVVAKGLDLPHLRTVGVIQADAGLTLPDYQSSERTFQLLHQVSGRVGRNEHPSSVIIQTYQPSHPAIICGITKDYDAFYKHTIPERKKAYFPPFSHLLKLVCIYKTEATAIRNCQSFSQHLKSTYGSSIQVLGPTPAFYERVRDTYRWQIIIKSAQRPKLVSIAQELPSAHWQYELDPASLL